MNNDTVAYPLCVSTWGPEEKKAMLEVMDSDRYTQGPKVKAFEQAFAAFMGTKYACMVNSGSSANLLAIAALFFRNKGIRLMRGDEVIVPAVSWATTYAPLQQYGLHVKFVDVDPETLNISPEAIARNLTEKTKLILAVNLLGNPVDIDGIIEVTKDRDDILVVEDNCESMGATYKGRQMGTYGILGTYSTFFSHHISTMEGGLVVTDNEELYQIMISLRAHGWTRELPEINALGVKKSKDSFYNSFNFILPGYNLRSGELNGAIGTQQLLKLPSFVEQRKKNAKKFLKLMDKYKEFLSVQKETGSSSWFGFALLCKKNVDRVSLVQFLAENNIETRPIVAGDFTKNLAVTYFDHSIDCEGLPVSSKIDTDGFFLGNHHTDMTLMFESLDKVLTKYFKQNVVK